MAVSCHFSNSVSTNNWFTLKKKINWDLYKTYSALYTVCLMVKLPEK